MYYFLLRITNPIPLSLRQQPKTITLDQIPLELKDTIIGLALGKDIKTLP